MNITCKLCNKEFSSYGFASHIKYSHDIPIEDYVSQFGEFRELRKNKGIRKLNKIECKICKQSYSTVGFYSHLKNTHHLSIDEYVLKYGEYRKKELEIQSYDNGELKCLIDNKTFKTRKQLAGYLKRMYKMTFKNYILKYIFKNEHPKCQCGCGGNVKIISSPPHCIQYISGHNNINPMSGKCHTNESKKLMSDKANNRIQIYKRLNLTLPMHSKSSLEKRGKIYSQKMMDKKCKFYNVTLLNSYEEQKQSIYKFQCNKCSSQYTQYHNSYFTCKKCYPPIKSKYEEELSQFLSSLNITYVRNYRKMFRGTMEIDFYIPEFSIGIEFNGLYYHSELSGNKDKFYHIHKTEKCNNEGIQLIHIFENDWNNKKEIIKNKLKHILHKNDSNVINARQCIVKQIEYGECNEFLNKNHIQGSDKSFLRYGLYFKENLISVMTFSKPNVSKGKRMKCDDILELSRYCVDNNFRCNGSFSKLLKFFIKNNHLFKKIYTYADRKYSNDKNNVYVKNNFSFVDTTPPNYFYTNDYQNLIHRFKFTKWKIIKLGGDKTLSEWENMKQMGYDRIWDCGNLKYELSL
jgi:hypothetical protein